jgi:hypothetical protein
LIQGPVRKRRVLFYHPDATIPDPRSSSADRW